jgi:hypothetical protein
LIGGSTLVISDRISADAKRQTALHQESR